MFSRYESLDTKKLKEGLADLRQILYSYRNHSFDLYSKSTDWFLYLWHISLKRSKRVKTYQMQQAPQKQQSRAI